MNSNNHRNRHKNKKLSWLIILLLHYASSSLADKTNVNEVTNLFDQAIPNKDGFVSHIEGAKAGNISDIESGASLRHIQDIDKTGGEISKLSSIRAVDLDDAGRAARQSEDYKFYDQGEFETNFNKPGYARHKQDVQEIVGATSALLGNITASLKDLGVDCSEVKGSVQKTPIHVIETKREEQRNTEYDQVICQQPKNQYRCTDSLSLRCSKVGKRYRKWEARTVRFNGRWLHDGKMDWGYAVRVRRKCWDWVISPHHPGPGFFGWPDQVDSRWRGNSAAIIADVRAHIAKHIGVSIDQIGEEIKFPGKHGVGRCYQISHRWRYIFDEYEFGYQYREAYNVCETWSEDWNQRCVLE